VKNCQEAFAFEVLQISDFAATQISEVIEKISIEDNFLPNVVFSIEATFHL
jgi:hypothetical protein